MSFTVAIVGRPNVGKSTLFNRLAGKKLAIVHDRPGVTRDRREGEGRLMEMRLRIIDTAGLEEGDEGSLERGMFAQTEKALAEAHVALFMIDGRTGLTPLDEHFAKLIRKSPTPVILVANKCESQSQINGLGECYALGLGDPVAISSEHNLGMGDLADSIRDLYDLYVEQEQRALAVSMAGVDTDSYNELDENEDEDGEDTGDETEDARDTDEPEDIYAKPLKLAIVGRPNVGKSTLVNALIEDERLLTGPEAGVTRDSIAVDWEWKGKKVKLVDTAGLRRRAKVTKSLEKLSAANTRRAAFTAQVVVLVMEADAILDKQDLTIARQVVEEGRGLVLAINKWDNVNDKKKSLQRLSDRLQTSLTQISGVPVVTISALERTGLGKLMNEVFKVYETWNRRIPTAALNRWFSAMLDANPPPLGKHSRRIKLRYITQAKTRPPTFIVFSSNPERLPESYKRYLFNGLRNDFNLWGTPLRLSVRKGKNPYADKKK